MKYKDATSEERLRARRARQRAAERYKPDVVRLLLVAEAPPQELERYFYFKDVKEQDSLFRYVAREILGTEPSRSNKGELLKLLRDRGVFLIDLKPDPMDGTPLGKSVSNLVTRCRRLAPEKIILIKVTVFDEAYHELHKAGLPVVRERISFPDQGRQKDFEVGFRRALNDNR